MADPFLCQGKLKFAQYTGKDRWHKSQRYKKKEAFDLGRVWDCKSGGESPHSKEKSLRPENLRYRIAGMHVPRGGSANTYTDSQT
jgi:hypothetical protein